MHLLPGLSLIFTCLLIMAIFNDMSEALRVCKTCVDEDECNSAPPDICPYGEGRDSCGRRVCAKGPNERCGGPNNVWGVCGTGLMCSMFSERCLGCYYGSLLVPECTS